MNEPATTPAQPAGPTCQTCGGTKRIATRGVYPSARAARVYQPCPECAEQPAPQPEPAAVAEAAAQAARLGEARKALDAILQATPTDIDEPQGGPSRPSPYATLFDQRNAVREIARAALAAEGE